MFPIFSRSLWLLVALASLCAPSVYGQQQAALSELPILPEPSSSSTAVPKAPAIAISLAVFSTYPSETLLDACGDTEATQECIEDTIAPEAFISTLITKSWFTEIKPFGNDSDYELLIANVAKQGETVNLSKKLSKEKHFTELTLQWRGIEIDSLVIASQVNDSEASTEKAIEPLVSWYKHATENELFTPTFLYHALNASDYGNHLSVPESLGDFTRLDTQLYPDPFKGSITRYTHPSFEDALVDVTVFPILAKLDTNASSDTADTANTSIENSARTDALLHQQLDDDWNKADHVANARNLTLSQPQPISAFNVKGFANGWRLVLKADSPVDDPIFATTYVFTRNDKIVKVATTFPSDFSDDLANELIAHITVPEESMLMQQVRAMLK
ncbi:hypothetical protein R1T43_07200 [Alteromonas sp. CI.11.F.A3]|uniref:hypothetical protein n=1 Tax=Alteromonas sp. CI.11.F.A3 TaxID=3079555 RepID=UPI002941FC67|nr:hypothetical protein [Alteromonas sp. CI.11.F.A3]WOI38810.1 hypothetical protein R1T43_07200 [Alteromonas sp. CI.11.F.A3]